MHRSSPLTLTGLRRHRGLWRLCLVMLLFKLLTGAVCLADTPATQAPAFAAGAAIALADVDRTSPDASDACLLGEAGGCHCACAHATPLATDRGSSDFTRATGFEPPMRASGYRPPLSGSLLRPPIA